MTKLYEHCTGSTQKSKNVYMVTYISGHPLVYGSWIMDSQEFKTESAAKKAEKIIKKEKALNGQTSIRLMPQDKQERLKLQANLNKF